MFIPRLYTLQIQAFQNLINPFFFCIRYILESGASWSIFQLPSQACSWASLDLPSWEPYYWPLHELFSFPSSLLEFYKINFSILLVSYLILISELVSIEQLSHLYNIDLWVNYQLPHSHVYSDLESSLYLLPQLSQMDQ